MRGWVPLGGGGEGNDQVTCGRYPSLPLHARPSFLS